MQQPPREASISVGVVLRRSPGATRWARWRWRVAEVLPGATDREPRLLRQEGEAELHYMGALTVTLHRAETESYRVALAAEQPKLWVICRKGLALDDAPEPFLATLSAYEAQDYADIDDHEVEPIPLPAALHAWAQDFLAAHPGEEEFVKRKRDKKRVDLREDGKGDARIRQSADVYRAPGALKPRLNGKTIH